MLLARTLAALALAGATAVAYAQTPAPPRERAAAPPAYQSAFEGYRPYVEEPPAPWRQVNDTVERVGGHVGVLRAEEATARPSGTEPAPAPAREPKEPGHDAHHRK
jgi:hypothetical protein